MDKILDELVKTCGTLEFKVTHRQGLEGFIEIRGVLPERFFTKESRNGLNYSFYGSGRSTEEAIYHFCQGIKDKVAEQKEYYKKLAQSLNIPKSLEEMEHEYNLRNGTKTRIG